MRIINEKYNYLKPYFCKDLIRAGRNQDGGYVVSQNSILKTDTLISFGLGTDWSFEIDYLEKNKKGIIYIYDHTINFYTFFSPFLKCLKRFLTFRKNYKDLKERYNKMVNYLAFVNNKRVFYYKKKIALELSNKKENLKNILKENQKIDRFILKVDIEGSEFETIQDIIFFYKKIDMLIIEFHELEIKENKFNEEMFKLNNYFDIIHIHGNNHCKVNKFGLPIALELTLLNKNHNLRKIENKIEFPLDKLDFPNNPNLEDIKFTFK